MTVGESVRDSVSVWDSVSVRESVRDSVSVRDSAIVSDRVRERMNCSYLFHFVLFLDTFSCKHSYLVPDLVPNPYFDLDRNSDFHTNLHTNLDLDLDSIPFLLLSHSV